MTVPERVASNPVLGKLAAPVLTSLWQGAEEVVLPQRRVLWGAGTVPDALAFIEEGELWLVRHTQVFKRVTAGAVLGLSGVIANARMTATVRAPNDRAVVLRMMPSATLRPALHTCPEALVAAVGRMAEFVREMDCDFEDLKLQRPPVARLLRLLSRQVPPELRLTQAQVALFICSHATNVSKAERLLCDVVRRENNVLMVTNPKRLAELCVGSAVYPSSDREVVLPCNRLSREDIACRLWMSGWFSSIDHASETLGQLAAFDSANTFVRWHRSLESLRTRLPVKRSSKGRGDDAGSG